MKKLAYIGLLFVIVLVFNCSAISQTTNSVSQTVMFAVNRSVKPDINTLASLQKMDITSNPSEAVVLKNQMKQQSSKVTISASNSISSKNVHIDLLSVLEAKKSVASNGTPLILTITE